VSTIFGNYSEAYILSGVIVLGVRLSSVASVVLHA
jgi:hypothetical protein